VLKQPGSKNNEQKWENRTTQYGTEQRTKVVGLFSHKKYVIISQTR
jgi:hypothetical protein